MNLSKKLKTFAHDEFSSFEKSFTDWDGNFSFDVYGNGINYDLQVGGTPEDHTCKGNAVDDHRRADEGD